MNVVTISQADYMKESPWSHVARSQARALADKLVATVGALDPIGDIRVESPQTTLNLCELAIPTADALVAFLDAGHVWALHREASQVATLLRMLVITGQASSRDGTSTAEKRLDLGWALALVQEKLDGIQAGLAEDAEG